MNKQKIVYSKDLAEYKEKSSKVFKKSGKIARNFYEKESFKLQHELVKPWYFQLPFEWYIFLQQLCLV